MLWPAWMAWIAASSTGTGTGVSQTPWARLMPPICSQATDMARISDCTVPGASWLRARREAAGAVGMGKNPSYDILQISPVSGGRGWGNFRKREEGNLAARSDCDGAE